MLKCLKCLKCKEIILEDFGTFLVCENGHVNYPEKTMKTKSCDYCLQEKDSVMPTQNPHVEKKVVSNLCDECAELLLIES